ncbi:MAG: extracellular solute-binding protein [Spirochaetes bacterium]|nr:extracellular solute-binding protein [Spirochaetota bacterium]
MRNLFLLILAALVIFSQYITMRVLPGAGASGVPYIYWVGTLSQDKPKQVERFRHWLKKRGLADFDVRIDANNAQLAKIVIQATAGIGGDVFDAYGAQVSYMKEMGLLHGFAKGELAKLSGVADSERYPIYLPETDREGLEYAVPFQISVEGLLVNRSAFARAGMAPPPLTWDIDTFEATGRAYMKKANANPNKPDHFFCSPLNGALSTLYRSYGVSLYNETLTRAAVDRGTGLSEMFARLLKWTYDDHILPTPSDMASMSQENSGYMQPSWAMFSKGRMALHTGCRFILMPLREMKCAEELDAVLPPHAAYPNSVSSARYLVAYAGSKHKPMATAFAAYLRSEDYNRQIVEGGDNLPPIPTYMDEKAYLQPAGFTNEWKLNAGFREIAVKYAIGREDSPFALHVNCERHFWRQFGAVFSKVVPPAEAVADIAAGVNKEIKDYLGRHPEKKAAYEAAIKKQAQIDALRAAGKKIPLALVDNIFLKKYYADRGLGE